MTTNPFASAPLLPPQSIASRFVAFSLDADKRPHPIRQPIRNWYRAALNWGGKRQPDGSVRFKDKSRITINPQGKPEERS